MQTKINPKTTDQRFMRGTPSPLFPNQGRDELNLVEFPFAFLQYQRNQTVKTLEFSDTIAGKDGQAIDRQWMVTGSDAHGLPVASDVDIVIALLALAQEQGLKSREVYFTRYDLLHIMGWGNRGREYGRVKDGLDRLTGTTIKAERAFYDNRKKAYLTRSFHIIDDYDLWDRAEDGPFPEPDHLPLKSVITWNRHIFRSLKTGYVKRLDTRRYFRLATPIAKQLFRYLDKKFYRDRAFQIDIFKLCHEHLGISRACGHVSKLKERLTPALEELVRDGYLASYRYAPSALSRKTVTVRVHKAAQEALKQDNSIPAAYFYQQLYHQTRVERPIPESERRRTETFVGKHGFDVFREFVDYVMHEKGRQWPDLATLTGAFNAFEDPFLACLSERDARQAQMQRERRGKAAQHALREGYTIYLASLRAQMKQQHPNRYAELEKEVMQLPEYQRCLSTFARYAGQDGPLSKAAREQAEREQQDIFSRHFVDHFHDQGALDFNAWQERHANSILEDNHPAS